MMNLWRTPTPTLPLKGGGRGAYSKAQYSVVKFCDALPCFLSSVHPLPP